VYDRWSRPIVLDADLQRVYPNHGKGKAKTTGNATHGNSGHGNSDHGNSGHGNAAKQQGGGKAKGGGNGKGKGKGKG
jgi:hypothetical protein